MADVFISYSRKDKDFVRRLNEALEKQNRDVWIDWEDIPRGVEWLDQIYDGIEKADTFVFIVSPDSLASEICNKEVAHAIEHHKRIIPLIRHDIDEKTTAGEWFNKTWETQARDTWRTLKAINWLMFREQDNFDGEFSELIKTIDTDQAHVQAHTRLLVRAIEWEKRGQNSSLLLRGSDLMEAETWLAASGNKEPRRSTLQSQYILASRRGENRRQRMLLGGVSVALIVALGLAALSFVLFKDAEYRGGISQSIALAAQAEVELEGRYPERSPLLALEALENYPYTWQAERALGLAVQNSRLRRILSGQTLGVYAYLESETYFPPRAAWSPDGTRILVANDDGMATVWDAGSSEQLLTLSHPDDFIDSADWSPDGIRIVTGSGKGVMKIWDAVSGSELLTFNVSGGPLVSVIWSPDGTRLLTRDWNTVQVRDAVSGEELLVLSGTPTSAVWSPDGTRILTSTYEGETVLVWNTRVWDAGSGEELLKLSGDDIRDASWSPDGTRIVTTSSSMIVWDAASGEELLRLAGGGSYPDWSPDGSRIVAVSDIESVTTWDTVTGEEMFTFSGFAGQISSVDWSPDGTQILTADFTGAIRVWDAASDGELFMLSGFAKSDLRVSATDAAWSPDGTRIVTSDLNNVQVWDGRSGEELLILPGYSGRVAWSSDGRHIIADEYGTVSVWDATTGDKLSEETSSDLPDPTGEFWSPDGTRFITTDWDTVQVWDAVSGDELFDLSGINGYPSVTWSPDGSRIIVASQDSTVKVWNAASGQEAFTLFGYTTSVNDEAWSPNGTRIVTATQEGTVRVWEVASGYELLTFPGQMRSPAWSPDGTRLLTVNYDGSVKVWRAWQKAEDLIAYARQCCVVRELTPEEREQFGLSPV
jgi:WD40 repeat protein